MSPKGKAETLWNLRVPMRDMVTLSADIHFPARGVEGGPYPAILERNCYTHQLNEAAHVQFTEHGYAVVLQDVRGRNDSDGTFDPLHQEMNDGYDTIEWIASQPWCTGAIGTIGGSYMGWTQWAAAKARPPHLRAIWAAAPAGRFGRQEPFNNGIFLLPVLAWLNLTSGRAMRGSRTVDWRRVYTHLPLKAMDRELGRDLPVWREWLAHPGIDQYWLRTALSDADFAAIDIPASHATGWWDSNILGTIEFFERMSALSPARVHQHLLIGPWLHENIGTGTEMGPFSFGATAMLDIQSEQVRWFDRWLKNHASEDVAVSRLFVTGGNVWREDDRWPPASTPTLFYLHSDGDAAVRPGSIDTSAPKDESPDVYRYDPADPMIAIGGDWDFYPYTIREGYGTYQAGFYDPPSDPLARLDVLVYRTEPLPESLCVIGVPTAELLASSDCPDTDWFVTLSDVAPDGLSLPLSLGQLRARYHESLERETLLAPGAVYSFRFGCRPIAHEFLQGHRIEVTVTSSRFPIADRNLNTGHPIGEDAEIRVATNTIFHDAERRSSISLPVVSAR